MDGRYFRCLAAAATATSWWFEIDRSANIDIFVVCGGVFSDKEREGRSIKFYEDEKAFEILSFSSRNRHL